MEYKLAKQLKDAGFPYGDDPMPADRTLCEKHGKDAPTLQCGECEFIYAPTLSELIEACGDDFESLVRKKIIDHTLNKKIIKFLAQARDVIVPDGRGKTPEEAIAKLWLALNKK